MSKEQLVDKIVEVLSNQNLWVVEQVYRFAVNMKGGAC